MGIFIAILIVIIIGSTVIGWYAMGNDPVESKIKMIAIVYGVGIGISLLIWFIAEVLSGWIFAILCFFAFASELLFKKQ